MKLKNPIISTYVNQVCRRFRMFLATKKPLAWRGVAKGRVEDKIQKKDRESESDRRANNQAEQLKILDEVFNSMSQLPPNILPSL